MPRQDPTEVPRDDIMVISIAVRTEASPLVGKIAAFS
jgi:hypothetical protein